VHDSSYHELLLRIDSCGCGIVLYNQFGSKELVHCYLRVISCVGKCVCCYMCMFLVLKKLFLFFRVLDSHHCCFHKAKSRQVLTLKVIFQFRRIYINVFLSCALLLLTAIHYVLFSG